MSAIRHGWSEKLPIAGDVATNTANPNEMTNSDDVRYHAAEAADFRCIHVTLISSILKEAAHTMFEKYPDVVEVAELREMLGGISKKLTYRLLASQEIHSVRIGRAYKIPKVCVIEYLTKGGHA